MWGSGEFRGLWAAYAGSLLGDQVARVALMLLVFTATGSPLAAAGGYAVTLLPALVGGPLLTGWADRYPRRTVMVGCDLAAAALIAAAAVPGLPLPVVLAVVFAVGVLGAPFAAARSALVRQVFTDHDQYTAATTITALAVRLSQVIGFAGGGLLAAAAGGRPALVLDAVSFAVSAAVVRLTVAARPAARPAARAAAPGSTRYTAELVAGMRAVFGDPRLRTLVLFAWLAGFHVVPTAVAAPYAAAHGGGAVAVGLLLAASTAGTAICVILLTTRVRGLTARVRLIPPLPVLAAVPLIGCAANPPLLLSGLLWAVAGAGAGYQVAANVAFMTAVADQHRGQAFGLASTGLLTGQGAALLLAGALAETISPGMVIAAAGIAGTLAAVTLTAATGRHLVTDAA